MIRSTPPSAVRARSAALRRPVAAAALAAFAGLSAVAEPALDRVDLVGESRTPGDAVSGSSFLAGISANGRYALYFTNAPDAVEEDLHGFFGLVLRDMRTGTSALVSVNAQGTGGGNGNTTFAGISSNGRYVVFTSEASDLVADDRNGRADVFLRDMKRGTTTLVSPGATPDGGGIVNVLAVHGRPSVSDDGRFVAFASDASDLADEPNGAPSAVFVRDVRKRTTRLASPGLPANFGARYAYLPALSANGRHLAFVSDVGGFVADDANGVADVFVRDLKSGAVTLVSAADAGTAALPTASSEPSICANGRYVAFSTAPAGAPPQPTDVFVRDVKAKRTVLVNVNAAGTGRASGNATSPSISGNGRRVAFTSDADDLCDAGVLSGNGGTQDVFLRDVRSGRTTLVSANVTGTSGGDGDSGFPMLSGNGKTVGFSTAAENLGVPLGTSAFATAVSRTVR